MAMSSGIFKFESAERPGPKMVTMFITNPSPKDEAKRKS